MPFPRSLLNDEEEVVLELHPHWWFLAGPVLAVAAGLVLVIVTVAPLMPVVVPVRVIRPVML